MPLFWWRIIVTVGIIIFVLGGISCLRSGYKFKGLALPLVGLVVAFVGWVGVALHETKERTQAIADIVARTVVVRGTVDVKDEWWSLKSPTPKNGGHRCLITLKELPFTFSLQERGSFGEISCSQIKIRDRVRITFVRPVDSNMLEVEAWDLVDLTYEDNAFMATYPTEVTKRDSEGVK